MLDAGNNCYCYALTTGSERATTPCNSRWLVGVVLMSLLQVHSSGFSSPYATPVSTSSWPTQQARATSALLPEAVSVDGGIVHRDTVIGVKN